MRELAGLTQGANHPNVENLGFASLHFAVELREAPRADNHCQQTKQSLNLGGTAAKHSGPKVVYRDVHRRRIKCKTAQSVHDHFVIKPWQVSIEDDQNFTQAELALIRG